MCGAHDFKGAFSYNKKIVIGEPRTIKNMYKGNFSRSYTKIQTLNKPRNALAP